MPAATTPYNVNQLAYNYYDPFLESRFFETQLCQEEGQWRTLRSSQIDKIFLRLNQLFAKQFAESTEMYDNVEFEAARVKFSQSCSALLELSPDVISFELTSDLSILYTIKHKDYTLFIEHFLDNVDESEDEMIVSVYKGKEKLPSYAGSLASCLIEINNIFEGNTIFVELPLNEVSF